MEARVRALHHRTSQAVPEAAGALADWLAPPARASRHQSRDVIVPDVRGLFASAGYQFLYGSDPAITLMLFTALEYQVLVTLPLWVLSVTLPLRINRAPSA